MTLEIYGTILNKINNLVTKIEKANRQNRSSDEPKWSDQSLVNH